MVGKRRNKKSVNDAGHKPSRRSISKKNYKEKSTQSEDSDVDVTDEDFEPLKKVARRLRERVQVEREPEVKKESINEKVSSAKPDSGSNAYMWQMSKPSLSESESSDDEVCIKKLEVNRQQKGNKIKEEKIEEKQNENDQVTLRNASKKPEDHKYGNLCKTETAENKQKSIERDMKIASHSGENLTYPCSNYEKDCFDVKVICEREETCLVKEAVKENEVYGSKAGKNSKEVKTKEGKSKRCAKTDSRLSKRKKDSSKGMKDAEKIAIEVRKGKGQPKKNGRKTQKESEDVSTKIKRNVKQSLFQNQNEEDEFFFNSPWPNNVKNEIEESENDSENEWEDVNEAIVEKMSHVSPRKKRKIDTEVKDISIDLKVKSIHKSKRQTNKEKFLQCAERAMRKFQNQTQANLHKCHLVCLVARLHKLNGICNDSYVKAICLSFVPNGFVTVPNAKWDLQDLKRFVNWFKSGVLESSNFVATYQKISGKLTNISMNQIFVAALRVLGLMARLVMSLQPMTWKVENSDLFRLKDNGQKEGNEKKVRSKSPVKHLMEIEDANGKRHTTENVKSSKDKSRRKSKISKATSPYFDQHLESEMEKKSREGKKSRGEIENEMIDSKTTSISPLLGSEGLKKKARNLTASRKPKKTNKAESPTASIRYESGKRKRKTVNYKGMDVETGNDGSNEESFNEEDDEDDLDDFMETPKRSFSSRLSQKVLTNSGKKTKKSCMPSVEGGYARKLVQAIDDDDEFEKTSKPAKKRRSLNNKRNSPSVQMLSSDSESSHSEDHKSGMKQSQAAIDLWCEVYLKSVKRWISIELVSGSVDDVSKCEMEASKPLEYVLGIDNRNAIKDVTCRYASKFMSKTRKLRINREWWAATLKPYETREKKLEKEEDSQLTMGLMQQPFPTTIGEFKNHPLYVLEGDMLKFEAIYPEQPAVLGYFRNKAIYSRECVHVLHTRENWLKEARVVKQGETAYKIVKGRPKRTTPVHERDKVKIDLFGLWQTEIYKPPPIVNGKVPRNEYGNVELFQPSMIPPGGVHVPIQGIHKTARKLGIDAAPAMMGWDFHGGRAHPIIEGVVVAAEFEEKLLDAWQKDEDERERKLKEKNEKKIIDRWKMMVKGLLVRERIRRKYDFRDSEDFEDVVSHKDEKEATNMAVCWPLNKLEGTTSVNEKGHCHIFPESSYKQDKISGEWTKSCSCGLVLPFEKL